MSNIKITKGYRFRLYPNATQKAMLANLFGCCRYVYNWGLARRRKHYQNTGRSLNSYDLSKELTQHKKESDKGWLNEVLRMPLRVSLFNLDRAFKNFYEKRAGYPKFKTKNGKQSAKITRQYFSIQDNRLSINKMPGAIRVRWSRHWQKNADVSSVTVSKDRAGRYFASFLVTETIAHLPPVKAKIGIDMGLSHFLTLSTGEKVENPKFFVSAERRYRRACKNLSRKQKGSKNRAKARLKLSRIASRISDSRRDFCHQLSSRLIRENQAIGVEDLGIQNMMKNRRLSKAIGDASWGTFLSLLSYKAAWYGKDVVTLDTFFASSKTCSICGHKREKLPLYIRKWACSKCQTLHDRDVNAAINIQKHTVGETEMVYNWSCFDQFTNACGVPVSPHLLRQRTMKQELSLQR